MSLGLLINMDVGLCEDRTGESFCRNDSSATIETNSLLVSTVFAYVWQTGKSFTLDRHRVVVRSPQYSPGARWVSPEKTAGGAGADG